MGPRLGRVAGAALLLCGLLAGVGDAEPGIPLEPATRGTWTAMADGPLSPRMQAGAAWTGREMIVFGGHSVLCAQSHCYPEDRQALGDAAAYDPVRDAWRKIADLPVRGVVYTAVAAGGELYTEVVPLPPRMGEVRADDAVFLAYSVADDRWRRIAYPPGADHLGFPQSVGSTLVFDRRLRDDTTEYSTYDAAADSWAKLPPHPFGHATVLSDGPSLLYAVAYTDATEGGGRLTRAPVQVAVLDLSTRTWTRLPDMPADIGGASMWWSFAGGRLIGTYGANPLLGAAYNPTARTWSRLPSLNWEYDRNTVYDGSAPAAFGRYLPIRADHVLDVPTGAWGRLPPHRALAGDIWQTEAAGVSSVWAGDRLIVWVDRCSGCASAESAGLPELRDFGWVWTAS